MKTIIAGSRSATERDVTAAVDDCPFAADISEVICGCCTGADRHGWQWARNNNLPVRYFPAWPDQYDWADEVKTKGEVIVYPNGCYIKGKASGIFRNIAMSQYGEALIAVPAESSRGTIHMIDIAKKRKLQVSVWKI